MQVIPADQEGVVSRAVSVLRAGGAVVYPTDTLYALGCDATNAEAVRRVFQIKRRPLDKPLPIAVANIEMMRRYCELDERAERLARALLPGALTLLLKKKHLPDILTSGSPKVAVRIPANELALKITAALGRPVVATSANISGEPPPVSAQEALAQLRGVELVIDAGVLARERVPSTIYDPEEGRIIRQGKIDRSTIEEVLRE
ncbi:MAG: threonylcarbamoyl-AMP synthase [Euryarchaeota archaeon]|nr:threonylcarbamoyl-AMP synthase [Euryarchaeota archaeon]